MKIKLLRAMPVRVLTDGHNELHHAKEGDVVDAHPIDGEHLVKHGAATICPGPMQRVDDLKPEQAKARTTKPG